MFINHTLYINNLSIEIEAEVEIQDTSFDYSYGSINATETSYDVELVNWWILGVYEDNNEEEISLPENLRAELTKRIRDWSYHLTPQKIYEIAI